VIRLLASMVLALATCSGTVFATNEYYYKNMLVGERAFGLGGAYVAISDDPSGVFHNPAGMVYSLENYVSLSANAFMSSEQKFKDVYPGQDYTYTSEGFVPSFFGFIQNWGKSKFGFAIAVPHTDNLDQSDVIERNASGSLSAKGIRRKFLKQETAYQAGPAFGTSLSDDLSIGFSLMGYFRITRLIDNTLVLYDPVGTGKYFWQMLSANRTSYAVVPKFGLQYMPNPKLSIGWTIEKPLNVGGKGTAKITKVKLDSNNEPGTLDGTADNDLETTEGALFTDIPSPISTSLGFAYFMSRSWLVTAQIDGHMGQSNYAEYPVQAVVNWTVAGEYYLNESFAVRLGAFSNNAKTRPIDPNAVNQRVHVNLLGFSSSVSMYRSGTSLTLGAAYGFGKGEGQAFGDTAQVQVVQHKHLAVYLAGSYQL
jgi:long-chain fatty acid transport protein